MRLDQSSGSDDFLGSERSGRESVRSALERAGRQRAAVVAPRGHAAPGFAAHFRIFVLGSGGREAKNHAFSVETLVLHITTMLRALDRLEQHGYAFGERRVDILARDDRHSLGDRVAASVGSVCTRKRLEHPYYSGGIRFMLWVTSPSGEQVPLADGGTFDWLAKLTTNQRNVYVASGMGSQLIPIVFATPA